MTQRLNRLLALTAGLLCAYLVSSSGCTPKAPEVQAPPSRPAFSDAPAFAATATRTRTPTRTRTNTPGPPPPTFTPRPPPTVTATPDLYQIDLMHTPVAHAPFHADVQGPWPPPGGTAFIWPPAGAPTPNHNGGSQYAIGYRVHWADGRFQTPPATPQPDWSPGWSYPYVFTAVVYAPSFGPSNTPPVTATRTRTPTRTNTRTITPGGPTLTPSRTPTLLPCSQVPPGSPIPCRTSTPSPGGPTATRTASPTPIQPTQTPVPGGCQADATTLCLDGHFAVKATWTKSDGTTGAAQAIPRTSNTGEFWFFDPSNIEMVVKALNGCSLNSHEWVFMGGLTNVQVATTVMDTQTGNIKVYQNPQGTAFQPIQDTAAFTCPAMRMIDGVPHEKYQQNTVSGYVSMVPTKPCNCGVINAVRKMPLGTAGILIGLAVIFGIVALWHRKGKRTL